MASPDAVSFTSQQLVTVLCSAIGALGGITAAAIRLLYNNIMKRFSILDAELRNAKKREHNWMRTVFMLLTRLHPERANMIVEAMENSMAEPPAEANGEFKSHWKP